LIKNDELARLLGVSASTLRVVKKWHIDKLVLGKHFIRFGFSQLMWWTKEGAGWIALHSGDGSFGKYLLEGDFDRDFSSDMQRLQLNSYDLLDRTNELTEV